MNYLRENKRGFLFNVFFIGLFILVFNIFVFKNESNAMSTTMDISNLSEMQIQKLSLTATNNAQSNVAFYQTGMIVPWVEPNVTGCRKNCYGAGSKVYIDVYFTKKIKSEKDALMIIKFQDKETTKETTYELNPNIVNNMLRFEHEIKSTDSGKLQILNLKGRVTDEDGNEIHMGLPNGEQTISYKITAKTTAKNLCLVPNVSDIQDSSATVEFAFKNREKETEDLKINKDIFWYDGKGIQEITKDNLKDIIKVKFKNDGYDHANKARGEFKAKVTNNSPNANFTYKLGEGEHGKMLVVLIKEEDRYLCDKAGNSVDAIFKLGGNEEIAVYRTSFKIDKIYFDAKDGKNPNPYVEDKNIKVSGKNYVKKDEQIEITVPFNEVLYQIKDNKLSNETDLTSLSPKKIKIVVGEGEEKKIGTGKITIKKSDDNKQLIINYRIGASDNGEVSLIIDEGAVYNETWYKNAKKTIKTECIADTTLPTIEWNEDSNRRIPEYVNQNIAYEFTCRDENEINIIKNSTIDVDLLDTSECTPKTKKCKCELERQGNKKYLLRIIIEIEEGENGKVYIDPGELTPLIYDKAGNTGRIANDGTEEKIKGIATTIDTEKPTISITTNPEGEETNKNVIEYTITCNDNYGLMGKTEKTEKAELTENEITVGNGEIISTEKGENGIKTVRVLAAADGVQRLYIHGKALEDKAGNKSENITKTIRINTAMPKISFETNGGQYVMPRTGNTIGTAKIGTKVTISENLESLEYAWTTSKDKPSNYKKLDNNSGAYLIEKTDINKAGTYYLHIKATSKSGMDKCGTSQPFVVNNSQIGFTNNIANNGQVIVNYGAYLTENRYAGFNNSREPNLDKITVTENGIVHAEATDKAGNKVVNEIQINNIVKKVVNINFETNGGQYVMPRTGDKAGNAKIGTKITASENLKSLEYAWTTSKDKPSNYKKLDNNSGAYLIEKTDINKAGTYYLHIKATSTSGNIGEATSNAFYIKDSQITLKPSKTEKTKDNIEVKIEYGECLTENRYAGFNNSREPNLEKVTVTENGIVHAEATDKAGNKVINEIQINNIVKEIPINFGTEQKTVLSTVNKDAVNYVIIKDGTNLENLLNTVQNKESVNITVKDKEDKDLQKTDIMKTGQKIYANGDTEKPAYVVIVKGDLNGDGKVDIFDMFEVNKYRINQLEPGIEQLIAGDLTGDSKLDIYDIFEINKVRIANVI